MSGNVKWLTSGKGGDSQCQKRCKKTSFAFYQAVRDLRPVWILEDMRIMEVLHWEEGGKVSAYSPSEALLYALVHDHQPYAQYLLSHFPHDALAMPGVTFHCCQSSAPHLAMAVRYNRVNILLSILKTMETLPDSRRLGHLDRRGCQPVENCLTPVHLACELLHPECLILLLGYGASPLIADATGNTPLDTLMRHLGCSQRDLRCKLLCLEALSLYLPQQVQFNSQAQLRANETFWRERLGGNLYQWLSGLCPPSLFMRSMQVLIRAIPLAQFPEALDELPLPALLKPWGLKWKH
ncbi:ankyrin repeat domain-containing protein 9 [Ambystoma mexicanum]|uniref:ankyrin repeat domain-containing protein 9 n=1 Tax=Ambystoma mexicanum TaxID=8296 RepID=UPI0037E95490